MLELIDKLRVWVVRTKEKLAEPVDAPRRKVIVVGIGILIIIGVAFIL